MTDSDWLKIIERVWHGHTVPEACEGLGFAWPAAYSEIPLDMRGYLVEVAMLARYRDEDLFNADEFV